LDSKEHLRILSQGVGVWNLWRGKNPLINPDLNHGALDGADLEFADLRKVNLSWASLVGADLNYARLRGANLYGAVLRHADLSHADLRYANLKKVILFRTNLHAAQLSGTDISNALFGETIFADTDLREVQGLETVSHLGPSTVGLDTLYKSRGEINESFLRGCGLGDWEIEVSKLYNPDLSNEEINNINYRIHDLRARRAFQISPMFISYSHADGAFVDAIEVLLVEQGIRFWRDVHNAGAGRLERQIDRAIDLNDVVLLVLSKESTNSDWVEHEARKAREKEKRTGKDALCPVALDDSWKTCRWPERLREQIAEYNIVNFEKWQDDAHFQKMFGKLLEGLNLFYK
jgi:uncharacterized protein YjbI with pentapeptide repeats